nr:hypothetical protein StreXyl84_12790 [Streptomyces sp. Xyl84]
MRERPPDAVRGGSSRERPDRDRRQEGLVGVPYRGRPGDGRHAPGLPLSVPPHTAGHTSGPVGTGCQETFLTEKEY